MPILHVKGLRAIEVRTSTTPDLMGTFITSLRRSARDQPLAFQALLFFLGTCIGLLFLTFYARHPFFLMGNISIGPEEFMAFFRNYVRPEPLESHLYHVGFIVTIAAALFTWGAGMAFLGRYRGRQQRLIRILTGMTILFFCALIVSLMPMINAVTVRELLRHAANGVHPLIFIGVLATTAGWILRDGRILRLRALLVLECVGILVLITLILFDPQYASPMSLVGGAGYHVWFFLAPVHDVLQGKHLLVDTSSQYGVLLIQTLAFLFRAGVPFSFQHFTLILMVLSVVYHFFLYLILRVTLRDRYLALLGILLVLSMGFLRHAAFNFPGEPYINPSALKLRFLFDLPVFALLTWRVYRRYWFVLPFAAFLSAISILWNSETGLSLCIAYLVYVGIDALQTSRWNIVFWRIFLHSVFLVASIGAVIGLFIWWTFWASGSLPDFSSIPFYMRLYYSGFGALPMPVVGAWSVLLFVYGAILLQAVRRVFLGERDPEIALRAGWAVYGLMIFHYYISHSASTNLSAVTMPAVVLGLLLLRDLRPALRHALSWHAGARIGASLSLTLILFVISLELTAGYASASDLFLKRWTSPLPVSSTGAETVDPQYFGFPLPAERYLRTAEKIRALIPAPARPLILSQQDFLYFWVLDSTNALVLPYQSTLALMSQARAVEKQIEELAPQYLFLDSLLSDIAAVPPCALCDKLRPFVEHAYIFRSNIGMLDVYERRLPTVP
ncbi:hypothetical protein HY464_00795 [Candidatus Peregrinibacteria bacterium]|nr:hypothetical protein [Candidatus Peregrinibacteria bacterium]